MPFFVGNVDRIINLNNFNYGYISVGNVVLNPNLMFHLSVTEEEVQKVISKLKGKFLAGYNEIPENIVKQCIQLIKKT
jgi:hypothetical protein